MLEKPRSHADDVLDSKRGAEQEVATADAGLEVLRATIEVKEKELAILVASMERLDERIVQEEDVEQRAKLETERIYTNVEIEKRRDWLVQAEAAITETGDLRDSAEEYAQDKKQEFKKNLN